MTVTIGGDTFDVYGSSAGLASYANGSLTWAATYTAASADNRSRALVEATRILNAQAWQGTKTSDGQPLAWPRDGLTVKPPSGVAVTDGVTPDEIVTGAYELALAILADTSIAAGTGASSNVQSVTAKGTGATFFSPVKGGRAPELPGRVNQWVRWALGGTASDLAPGGAYTSGTDGCSQFDIDDEYRLTRAP